MTTLIDRIPCDDEQPADAVFVAALRQAQLERLRDEYPWIEFTANEAQMARLRFLRWEVARGRRHEHE